MNLERAGSKGRIDRKIRKLKILLSLPKEEQDLKRIRKLKQSIKRNKRISRLLNKKRKNKKKK